MKAKRNIKLSLIAGFTLLSFIPLMAQEETAESDTLYTIIDQVRTDLNDLKKLKISGYVQAQYQYADSIGAKSFAGGNFPALSDNRFALRRGRLKFAYTGTFSQVVVQFDVSESGLSTKDAYFMVTEPWLNSLSLTAGIFNRPFGYEIEYSSTMRESPERSRMIQILFPQERDLGAKLTLQAPKTSRWNFIKLDLALVNGNGINADFDKQKDFIGHLSLSRANRSETIKYGLGASYYSGTVFAGGASANEPVNVYTFNANKFELQTKEYGSRLKREYIGFDGQFTVENPLGMTTLRGEYIFGTQPAKEGSDPNASTSIKTNVAPNYDTYVRNFSGFYVYFVQNILHTRHSFVAKYDTYDPNTKISGTNLTSAGESNLSVADIKFNTLGLGWIYRYDNNLKFIVYYDMVNNESTQIAPYTKDKKDNVLTARIQYKF